MSGLHENLLVRSFRAVLAPGLLLPIACLAALRALTYLMQRLVTVTLLPNFGIQGSTGGVGLAVAGAALDVLIWIFVLKLSIEALFDAHEFMGSDHGKADVVTDRAAVSLGTLLVFCMLPTYLALLWGRVGLALLWSSIALFYLPAGVHLLVFGSLKDALNPHAWLDTVRRRDGLRWEAPVLLGLVVLALCVGWFLLKPLMPPVALAVVSRFLEYGAIALGCALIGAASRTDEDEPATGSNVSFVTPEEADALAGAVHFRDDAERRIAIDALAYLVRCGAPEAIHDRYRELLIESGDRDQILKHSVHYIGVLVQLDRHGKAISVFEDSMALGQVVPFQEPGDLSSLVTKALELNRKTAAYSLAKLFDLLFPAHPWATEAKILKARLGVEQFGHLEEAIRSMSEVIAAQPDRDADGSLSALIGEWRATNERLMGHP